MKEQHLNHTGTSAPWLFYWTLLIILYPLSVSLSHANLGFKHPRLSLQMSFSGGSLDWGTLHFPPSLIVFKAETCLHPHAVWGQTGAPTFMCPRSRSCCKVWDQLTFHTLGEGNEHMHQNRIECLVLRVHKTESWCEMPSILTCMKKPMFLKSITTHSILLQKASSLFAGIASKPLHWYLAFS